VTRANFKKRNNFVKTQEILLQQIKNYQSSRPSKKTLRQFSTNTNINLAQHINASQKPEMVYFPQNSKVNTRRISM